VIDVEHLDVTRQAAPALDPAPRERTPARPPPTLAERIDAFRRREILDAVERCRGNWAAAARELGLHRSNLHHLARRMGIKDAGR
jgi:anaerobic nitric oxide reductase transcription regulator